MPDITIEQALYGSQGPGGYRFLARSPGFLEDWLPEAERLCTGFGERPAGVSCPAGLFAKPLGKRHVAIVQVADQGTDDAGRPGALGFHLLVIARADYGRLGGDPFQIADRYPPPWEARGDLPALTWAGSPPPPRTVAQVQQVLQRTGGASLVPDDEVPRGGSHVLLGGCQALVDGGRIVFERSAPDPDLLRGLWMLLPTTTRSALWPASFAFGNALHFDVLVVPRIAEGDDYTSYKTEQEAADYPEGRYELAVQTAAEAGKQDELDALFARRSGRDTLRLVVVMLIVLLILTTIARLIPSPSPQAPPDTAPGTAPAHSALDPPARDYPALDAPERQRVTQALAALAQRLNLTPAPDASAEQLLEVIDQRLGTPDRHRDPGPLRDQGPVQRQLRVLLWKQGVAAYREPGLNGVELVERLQQVTAGPANGKETRD